MLEIFGVIKFYLLKLHTRSASKFVAVLMLFLLSLSAVGLPAFAQGLTSAYLEKGVLFVKCDQCTKYVAVNQRGVAMSVDDFACKGNMVVFRKGDGLYSVVNLVTGQFAPVAGKVTNYAIDESTIGFTFYDPSQSPSPWLFAAPYPSSPGFLTGVTDNANNYKLGGGVLAFSKGNELHVATDLTHPQQTALLSRTGGANYRVSFGVVTYLETAAPYPGLYALSDVNARAVRLSDHVDKYFVGSYGGRPYVAYLDSGNLFVIEQLDQPVAVQVNSDQQTTAVKVYENVIAYLRNDHSLYLALQMGMGGAAFVGTDVAQFSPGPDVLGYLTTQGDFYIVPQAKSPFSIPVVGQVTDFAIGHDGTIAFLSQNIAYIVTDKFRGTYKAIIANVSSLEVTNGIVHFVNNGEARPIDYFLCQGALSGGP